MKLTTKNFGEIEIDESKIINFELGLPGFNDNKRFILLSDATDSSEASGLFWWLQSVDDGNIAFVLMDVFRVKPDYSPSINQDDIICLGECATEDLLVYNITVIPDDINNLTVNLAAPVIINSLTRKGRQVLIDNEEYEIKCYMYNEIKNRNS